MKIAFAQAAAVQRDLCNVEQLRAAYMEASAARMVARGQLGPGPSIGFAGLRRRLETLDQIATFLAVLADHEDAVRALDPRLTRELPSMWAEGSGR